MIEHLLTQFNEYQSLFDELSTHIVFNFVFAVGSVFLGSWVFATNSLETLILAYMSSLLGFFLSNLSYIMIKPLLYWLLERCPKQDAGDLLITHTCLNISSRWLGFIAGFMCSAALTGVEAFGAFVAGATTGLLFLALAVGMGLVNSNALLRSSEHEIIEPGMVNHF